MSHVAFDDELVDADRGYEVPPGPQALLFIESVGPFDFLLHPGGGLALQYLHDVGDGVLGCSQENEMDVVFLDVELEHLPVFPLGDVFEHPLQF